MEPAFPPPPDGWPAALLSERQLQRRPTPITAPSSLRLILAGLVLALLGASYGAFAVVALHSVRSGDGAFPAADFYGPARPWEQPRPSPPPLGPRLALVGPQGRQHPEPRTGTAFRSGQRRAASPFFPPHPARGRHRGRRHARIGPDPGGGAVGGVAVSAGDARAEPQEFVILFGTAAARLTPEAQEIVALIAKRAGTQHPATLDVAGYGDSDTGSDAALGDQRAEAVIHALIDAGVAPGRIKKVPPAPPAAAAGIPVHKVTVTFE